MKLREGSSDGIDLVLIELARIYADKDRLESAKLSWLALLFTNKRNEGATLEAGLEELNTVGLKWFGYFTRRWLRQAMSQ